MFGKMDPFIRVLHKGQTYQTKVLDEAGTSPVWNEVFSLELESPDDFILIQCLDEDIVIDDFIGEATFTASQLCTDHGTGPKKEWYELLYKQKKSADIQLEGRMIHIAKPRMSLTEKENGNNYS